MISILIHISFILVFDEFIHSETALTVAKDQAGGNEWGEGEVSGV